MLVVSVVDGEAVARLLAHRTAPFDKEGSEWRLRGLELLLVVVLASGFLSGRDEDAAGWWLHDLSRVRNGAGDWIVAVGVLVLEGGRFVYVAGSWMVVLYGGGYALRRPVYSTGAGGVPVEEL